MDSDHFPVVISVRDEGKGSSGKDGNAKRKWRWKERSCLGKKWGEFGKKKDSKGGRD